MKSHLSFICTYLFITLLMQSTSSQSPELGEKILVNTKFHGSDIPRYYYLVKPDIPNVDKIGQSAALISIHGQGSFAKFQAYFDGFWKDVGKYQMTVVYVQGTCSEEGDNPSCSTRSWNGGNCCGHAWENNIDDIAYFQDVIDSLVKDHFIDKDRIFVTGWSNGGFMTWRLVCELGDQLRGAVTFAAPFGLKKFTREQAADNTRGKFTVEKDEDYVYFDKMVTPNDWFNFENNYECEKGSGVPMLVISGTKDRVHQYDGFLAIQNGKEWGAPPSDYGPWYFANLNEGKEGFTTKPEDFDMKITYSSAVFNKEFEFTTECNQFFSKDSTLTTNITHCVGNGGHVWWGSEQRISLDGFGATKEWLEPSNQAFDVSEQVFQFFCENGADCKQILEDEELHPEIKELEEQVKNPLEEEELTIEIPSQFDIEQELDKLKDIDTSKPIKEIDDAIGDYYQEELEQLNVVFDQMKEEAKQKQEGDTKVEDEKKETVNIEDSKEEVVEDKEEKIKLENVQEEVGRTEKTEKTVNQKEEVNKEVKEQTDKIENKPSLEKEVESKEEKDKGKDVDKKNADEQKEDEKGENDAEEKKVEEKEGEQQETKKERKKRLKREKKERKKREKEAKKKNKKQKKGKKGKKKSKKDKKGKKYKKKSKKKSKKDSKKDDL